MAKYTRKYIHYTDEDVEQFSYRYILTDLTLQQLEDSIGVSHSTMWICFQRRLANINPELYDLVMKKLNINKHIGGNSNVRDGRTVITSKQSIEVPHFRYEEKDIRTNMIIWRFRTEEDAIRAGRKFMNLGFDVVRRLV